MESKRKSNFKERSVASVVLAAWGRWKWAASPERGDRMSDFHELFQHMCKWWEMLGDISRRGSPGSCKYECCVFLTTKNCLGFFFSFFSFPFLLCPLHSPPPPPFFYFHFPLNSVIHGKAIKLPCEGGQDLEVQDFGFTGCVKWFARWSGPSAIFWCVCALSCLWG